jgi:hypothetical protein
MKKCKFCLVELNSSNTAGNKCQNCHILVMNHFHPKFDLSGLEVANLNVIEPDNQEISWDPNEYKIIEINIEQGKMKMERIK